jgi:hypothetical protein
MTSASATVMIVACVSGLTTAGVSRPNALTGQVPDVSESVGATLVGAGVGAAAGFGLAGVTRYELQEGGALVVALLGGGLGAVTANKFAESRDRPWGLSHRVQVAFPWAIVWSEAPEDIETAFSASGYGAADSHHSLAPAVTISVDIVGPLQVGGEVSGIRGVRVRDEDVGTHVTESVDGENFSFYVLIGRSPSQDRRLTYFGGGGVARTAITVLSYFDQKENLEGPPALAQPRRSSRAEANGWHPLIRAGLEFNFTDDVALRFEGVRRWAQEVSVPAIELLDPTGNVVRQLENHPVSLRSFQLSLGFGLRY